jgi:hypothetical protein
LPGFERKERTSACEVERRSETVCVGTDERGRKALGRERTWLSYLRERSSGWMKRKEGGRELKRESGETKRVCV